MKRIDTIFEFIGKRKKLIGFRAFWGEHEVGEYATRRQAELALDEYVFNALRRAA